MERAEALLSLEREFQEIVTTRGLGQIVLNVELGMAQVPEVKEDLRKANEKITDWVKGVGEYFNVQRRGEFKAAMTFFFPGNEFNLQDHIEYGILAKNIHGVRIVSDEMRAPDQYDVANYALATLGETMQRVNQMKGGSGESKKDLDEAECKKAIRDNFKASMLKWYQELVISSGLYG